MCICRYRRWAGLPGPRPVVKEREKAPAPTSEVVTVSAVETAAFFGGIAIVFSLVEILIALPFLRPDEFVYGLSFNIEILTLRRALYPLAILSLVSALCLAVASSRLPKLQEWVSKKFNEFFCTPKRMWWFVSGFLIVLCGGMYIYWNSSQETRAYVALVYVFMCLLGLGMFLRCTFLGRVLVLFAILMVIFSILVVFKGRNIDGDMPVQITLQNGSILFMRRCTISRESLALLKDSKNNYRIIPLSNIKEIQPAPDTPAADQKK